MLYIFLAYLAIYFVLTDFIFKKDMPLLFTYGFWFIFGMYSGFFIVRRIIAYLRKHEKKYDPSNRWNKN